MTPAFIHFMGADEMLAEQGPDALADALDAVIRIVERAAHEHQVAFFETDIAPSGGKVMLMAGAPRSTGNDEEAMLRAMRAVIDADSPLPLRIGVNWGRIFVSDFGPAYRRTYSVKGDAVNLAARLMAKAEPGQILTTDDVLERARSRFDTVALEPFEAKGKSEPVQAYVVGPPLGVKQQRLVDRARRPRERVVPAARGARPRSPLRGTDRRARGRAGHGEVKAGRGALELGRRTYACARSSARSTTRPRRTSPSGDCSSTSSRAVPTRRRTSSACFASESRRRRRTSSPGCRSSACPSGSSCPIRRRPRCSATSSARRGTEEVVRELLGTILLEPTVLLVRRRPLDGRRFVRPASAADRGARPARMADPRHAPGPADGVRRAGELEARRHRARAPRRVARRCSRQCRHRRSAAAAARGGGADQSARAATRCS